MLAAMKGSIAAEITEAAGKANWGIVLGSFKWVYALLSPVGGYMADRVSRRLVVIGESHHLVGRHLDHGDTSLPSSNWSPRGP